VRAHSSHLGSFVSCAWRATFSTSCTCSSLSTSRDGTATCSSFRLPVEETRLPSASGGEGATAEGRARRAPSSALASAMSGP